MPPSETAFPRKSHPQTPHILSESETNLQAVSLGLSHCLSRATTAERVRFRQDAALVDLVKDGVLDPAKVTRIALENASSIAGLLLTTDAIIAERPEEKKNMPQMPGGMGDMGGMY
jgi:chaperonin GroEL (HSP60 family)